MKRRGVVHFLKFITKKYKNWENQQVKLSNDDLKTINLKKTVVKTVFHYHPDRQIQDKKGVYLPKDIYIR